MLNKLIKNIFILIVVILVISITINHFVALESNDLLAVEVIQVYDGDTIQVAIGNSRETVRMIGIDTPETKGKYNEKDEFYGQEAANFLKNLIPKGTTIYLEADVENRDQYDRLLRYVYLDQGQEIFANLILLEKGYAETMFFEPNTKYYELFKTAETEAKDNNLGMWQNR
ncbi:MAG TPA: thermonuclease family protein [Clostridia bacterium]|nr:thermonuclease family protein [Clostridia bacterium]